MKHQQIVAMVWALPELQLRLKRRGSYTEAIVIFASFTKTNTDVLTLLNEVLSLESIQPLDREALPWKCSQISTWGPVLVDSWCSVGVKTLRAQLSWIQSYEL